MADKLLIYLIPGTWADGFWTGWASDRPRLKTANCTEFGVWANTFESSAGIINQPTDSEIEFPWYRDGSEFCRRLSAQLRGLSDAHEGTYKCVGWSKRNTIRARRAATADIIRVLRSDRRKDQTALQVVIAHSHAGNSALSAIARLPLGEREFLSLVTMSTPFLNVRNNVLNPNDYEIFYYALTGTVFFLIAPVIGIFIQTLSDKIDGALGQLPFAPVALSAFWLCIIAAMLMLLLLAIEQVNAWRRDVFKLTRRRKLVGVNLLILRAPGDEASLALSWAGMWNHAVKSLWLFFSPAYKVLVALMEVVRKHITHYYIGVIVIVILSGLFLSGSAPDVSWHGIQVRAVNICLLTLAVVPFCIVFLVFAIAAVLSIPLLLFTALVLLPYGYEAAGCGLEIEIYAEPLPVGCWPLQMLSPEDLKLPTNAMRHSIYESAVVVDSIAEWILARGAERTASLAARHSGC